MKRSGIIIILAALFFNVASKAFAENITVQTAQQAAQSFLNSKMEGNPRIHLIDFAEKAEFLNFYVFGNERCFVIIAAKDCVQPVLGYSTENSFETDGMPEMVFDWLKRYEDALTELSEISTDAMPEVQAEWDNLISGRGLEPKTRTRVMPLIKTKWSHKKAPFNDLCPADTNGPGGHARGGCGAGAMSQLMNYWEHPVRGVGSYSYSPEQYNHQHPEYGVQSANFAETVYDWDNMKNVYAMGYNEAEGLAVATLIYHCAVSLRMNFGPINSYTNPSRIATALKTYFDYSQSTNYQLKSDYTDVEWKAMLKNDLNLGRPVIYRGRDVTDANGHIFICDGYDENDYFHFNFDWAGNYDGYYAIGNININGLDYDHSNTAVFDCYPNPTSINPPANINATVLNRNVTITWSSVSDASCYKLYRDEDLVANNIQSTSYTDSDVAYGSHSYYVKSVKTDGTMSLRSNTAVADVHFAGPATTNLQASVNGYNIDLSWQTPSSETAILQYGTANCTGRGGTNTEGTRTSWAQRFPVSIIQDHVGMAIEKVGFYVYSGKTGEYTVGIYKGDEMNANELVYQQSYNATSSGCWHDIVFPTPIAIDYSQDLWIVFYSFVFKPASYCAYSGPYHDDAIFFSNTQTDHWLWQRLTDPKAWLIKAYLTDGTYTYNLYRNGDAIATDLSGNTYTDSNLSDGIYNYHVTTNYFGGESDPSDTVNVQIGVAGVQTTAFASGWNWWSGYVELGSNSLSLLEDGLGTNGVAIKSQDDGYASYLDGFGWYGSLSGLNNESSYQVSTIGACEVEMTGSLVNPATHPITLHPGWTWIGYPVNVTMGVDEALSGIIPQTGDMLKSQNDGFASYLESVGWYGSLTTLNPGMGLMYKSNNGSSVTLTYPNGGSKEDLKANQTSENNHWQANLNAYPDNMSVMAVVELDEEELHSEHYELAAFANNECRGSARLMYVEPIDRYMAFLTVAGDETAELRFSLYDTETGEEYHNANGTLTYENNAVVGSFENPFILGFHGTTGIDDEDSLVRVYPNPANDIIIVEGKNLRRVTVYNVTGQLVEDWKTEGKDTIQIIVQSLSPGFYVLQLISDSGIVTKHFIKE